MRKLTLESFGLLLLTVVIVVPLALWKTESKTVEVFPGPIRNVSVVSTPVFKYKVTRVWDGDTIQVLYAGAKKNVRFLGIDTPETHRPNTPVQCWGPEAYRYTKAQLPVGTDVVLHSDPTQPLFDRYGRLLAYVYIVKGKSRIELNYRLVRYGFAHSYHYQGTSVTQAPKLDRAEAIAKANKLGFWGPPCNGDTKQPEP